MVCLFLALLLLSRGRRGGGVSVDEDGLVFASDAGRCRRLLAVVQLLHEVLLDRSAALLPPLLLGVGLVLDIVKSLPEDGVGCDFVGGLEDGLAPVRCKGVGLYSMVSKTCFQTSLSGAYSSYLHDHVPQLLFHLLLCAAEPLPQVIAHASPLQERATRSLRGPNLDDAVDVLDGAPQQRCSQNAIGDLWALFRAVLGLEMEEGEIDVALQMRTEPRLEVCALSCRREKLTYAAKF